jgi:dihydrolipoamide dehydrogenase
VTDDRHCTALVVGAGPGGYVAAIRLGQLGVDTIVVDPGTIGGTCLNIGCIPSKALIHAADEFATVATAVRHGRFGMSGDGPVADMSATTKEVAAVVERLTTGVTGLVRHAGAVAITGRAEIVDGKAVDVHTADGTERIRCEHLVLATGSRPAELGVLPFGGDVISSTEALFLDALPVRLAVVGAGYIGLELGTAFAKLGAQVTVVEIADRVLPLYDAVLTKPVASHLRALGVEVHLGAKAAGLDGDGALRIEGSTGERAIAADKVLVTVGRVPVTDGWGLERLDLDRSGPYVTVDEAGRTSMRNVWAIGDLTGEPMLAHRAMAQGEAVAGLIAGNDAVLTQRAIPAVVYTDPEIVTAGLSPEEAGPDALVALSPLQANGRALTMGRKDGFVRVVARKDDHAVVGLQAVGAAISEFATTFALALEMGARLEDIAATVAAHPTLGEALQEAAMAALGRPRHSR